MAMNPDSYCGIYCAACSVRSYGETGRADGFASCCGPIPKGELSCDGCKTDRVYAGCRTCSLRDCARKRGFSHCIDCADYPCADYRKWQSAAKLLPHVRESVANLEVVKRDGTDAWLAAQEKRWSCPSCGTRFSWYAATCGKCGQSLAGNAHAMSGLRKIACRVVLPLVYWSGRLKAGAGAGSKRS